MSIPTSPTPLTNKGLIQQKANFNLLAHSLHPVPAQLLLLHDLEGPEREEHYGRLSETYPTMLRESGTSIGREPTCAAKIMDFAALPDLCPVPPGSPGTALSHYVYCAQALEWKDSFH